MSSTVDQLKALLSRVEERRNGPRLRAVPPAVAATPAPANEVRHAERISALPERKPPAGPTPLEHAIAGGLSPTPIPGMKKPSSDELVLDDFEPPQTAVARAPGGGPRGGETAHRTAPTMPQTDPFAGDPFASPPPPAPAPRPSPAAAPAPAAKAPVAAAPAPAPTAPTARIAAPEPAANVPVARAVTRARVETPRTFGELLDLSLSLRPRE
jgi:hypothetical protein